MNRRRFAALLAGLAGGRLHARPMLRLEAIVAPRIPQVLVVRALSTDASLFELRVYRGSNDLTGILARAGIQPVLNWAVSGGVAYLIPFASLAAREKAWSALESDQVWVRTRGGTVVTHISIYRVAAG